jgi:hypothetical protein
MKRQGTLREDAPATADGPDLLHERSLNVAMLILDAEVRQMRRERVRRQ